MAAANQFSWVNYTSESVVKKDEDDISIIKSHGMRLAHRRRRDIGTATQPKKPRSAPKRTRANPLRNGTELQVRGPPTPDWHEAAIADFLADFAYPEQSSPVTAFQYLSFLPALYTKDKPRSALTEAVLAVSLARFSNKTQVGSPELAAQLTRRARVAYADALCLVNKCMPVAEARRSDDLLTALCLLAKFEMVVGESGGGLMTFHEKGQAALVNERGSEIIRTEVGAGLFRLVYVRHLLACLAAGERPEIRIDPATTERVFVEQHARILIGLVGKTADLRFELMKALDQTQSATDQQILRRLATQMHDVEANVGLLEFSLPDDVKYKSVRSKEPAPSTTRVVNGVPAYAPAWLNIFKDLQHASFWHVLFNIRLRILQMQSACIEAHRSSSGAYTIQSIHQLERLKSRQLAIVDQICASIPIMPGEQVESSCKEAWLSTQKGGAVAAHYMVWLLNAALTVPGVPSDQKAWLTDRLLFIGHHHGIREALLLAASAT